MPPTESEPRFATCSNPDCSRARAGEQLEWYRGAGEYCPECGEVLAPLAPAGTRGDGSAPAPKSAARNGAAATNGKAATATRTRPDRPRIVEPPAEPAAARVRAAAPWLYAAAGAFLVLAIIGFAVQRRLAADPAPNAAAVSVCAVPLAAQLAANLVRGYATASGTPASHFHVTSGDGACDVRFATASNSPDDVIAVDGLVVIVNPLNPIARLTDAQVRAIFSGAIRDWSELKGPAGAIVPILPDASTAEAKALDAALLFSTPVDAHVRRGGSSADITRFVAGPGTDSRRSIGLVTFGQAISAKVVPLAYLPPPSVVSIASHRYPYTLALSLTSDTGRSDAETNGLTAFAQSNAGAAIVIESGFIPREGM